MWMQPRSPRHALPPMTSRRRSLKSRQGMAVPEPRRSPKHAENTPMNSQRTSRPKGVASAIPPTNFSYSLGELRALRSWRDEDRQERPPKAEHDRESFEGQRGGGNLR